MEGFGVGTLNGNGQVWYEFNAGRSNYPRRPHAITYSGLSDSLVQGMRFLQSQMWTMTLIHSENVLLQDIYIDNSATNGASNINTDGADTIYANNITFTNWTVINGDDSISPKANSTNIFINDCEFRDAYERRVKTFTGIPQGYPPNGGGGGIGYASNLHFSNFTATNILSPWSITQCTSFEGDSAGCDTSLFEIRDVKFTDVQGTVDPADNGVVAKMDCSGASNCTNIAIERIDLKDASSGAEASQYLCDHVVDPIGFMCTGQASLASLNTALRLPGRKGLVPRFSMALQSGWERRSNRLCLKKSTRVNALGTDKKTYQQNMQYLFASTVLHTHGVVISTFFTPNETANNLLCRINDQFSRQLKLYAIMFTGFN
ncbi:MAG: hypothetical protein Q9159_005176 [Coniocarpon cinnabarinum]